MSARPRVLPGALLALLVLTLGIATALYWPRDPELPRTERQDTAREAAAPDALASDPERRLAAADSRAATETAPVSASGETAPPQTWSVVGTLVPAEGAPMRGARIAAWKGLPTDREPTFGGLMDVTAEIKGGAEIDLLLLEKGEPLATAPVDDDSRSFQLDLPAGVEDVRLGLMHRFHGFASLVPVHREGRSAVDVGRLETYAGGYISGRLVGAAPGGDDPVQLRGEPDPMQVLVDPTGFLASVASLARRTEPVDAEGRFEFEAVPPLPDVTVAWHDDTHHASTSGFGLAAGELREVLLVAGAAASLSVRVVEPDGTPAANALVVVQPYEARGNIERVASRRTQRTDEEGGAEYEGLEPVRVQLQAKAPGWRGVARTVDLSGGERTDVVLELGTGSRLTGTVRDEAGEPIPGAHVLGVGSQSFPFVGDLTEVAGADTLALEAEESPYRTDDEGRFEIRGLPDEGDVTVVAAHPDFAAGMATGIPAGRTEPVELVLRRPTRITGRVVVEGTDEPVTSFRVEANTSMLFFIDRAVVKQAFEDREDGTFRLDDVPPGRYTLEVTSELHGTASLQVELASDETRDVGKVELPPTASVAGRVVAPDGSPVPGALVFPRRGGLMDDALVARFFSDTPPAVTSADGSFSLGDLTAKRGVVLRATSDGWASGHSPRLELFAGRTVKGVVIELARGGDVRGRLLLPPGTDPGRWKILATRKPFGGNSTTLPAPDGSFFLKALDPGDWQIQAIDLLAIQDMQQRLTRDTLPGEIPDMSGIMTQVSEFSITEKVRVVEGGVVEVELDARDLGSPHGIRLAVDVRVAGRPIAEGLVEMTGEDSGVRHGVIDAGTWTVDNLQPGTYSVSIHHGRTFSVIGGDIRIEVPDLAAGSTHRASIELPGGAVRGVVLDEAGDPQRNVFVRLLREAGEGQDQTFALTDTEGRFRFEGLEAGTYGLRADTVLTDSGRAGQLEGLELASGQELDGLELVAGTGAILDLTVTDPAGVPLPRAGVVAVNDLGQSIASLPTSFTDGSGRARIAGLPEVDRCWLIARAANHAITVDGPFRLSAAAGVVERNLRLPDGVPVQVQAIDARGNDLSRSGLRIRIGDGPWIPPGLMPTRIDGRTVDLGQLPADRSVTFEVGGAPGSRLRFETTRRIPRSGRARYVLTP